MLKAGLGGEVVELAGAVLSTSPNFHMKPFLVSSPPTVGLGHQRLPQSSAATNFHYLRKQMHSTRTGYVFKKWSVDLIITVNDIPMAPICLTIMSWLCGPFSGK